MTTKFIDMTGKTEDEAISKALAALNRDRDEVSVEVLERAKKGFLGFGASPAKVRVTYEVPEETPAAPPVRPAAPVPPIAPIRPTAPVPSEAASRKQEKAEKAEKPEKHPDTAASTPRAPEKPAKSPKPQRPRKPVPPTPPVSPVPPVSPAEPVQPEDLGPICTDEKAQKIVTFLTGLLSHMDSAAEVKVYLPEEGRYKVILEGEKLGQLIGRRGETLDAIQQLTNYSVNRGGEKRVRVHVDAENYRLKREQSLQHLARKVAAKAVKYRRNVTLEPMNAYERHVIHTALQDVEHVTTYSMGTEPNRRVIVAYDRSGNKSN